MSDQARKVLAPVAEVLMDTPTYLEVPDFQRVAIIGDYASGVLYLSYVAYVSLLSRLDLLRSNPLCKRDLVQQDGPAHKCIHNTLSMLPPPSPPQIAVNVLWLRCELDHYG